jgi:hypothetical protein
VLVTGVVEGEDAPSTWAVRYETSTTELAMEWATACQRAALVAMSRPGQYLLEIDYEGYGTAGSTCRLSRATP